MSQRFSDANKRNLVNESTKETQMKLTAKELSGMHIGKTVTVEFRRSEVTGELDAIKHERETVLEDLQGHPIRTECWVTLTIGGIKHNPVGLERAITIQEGE